MAKFSPLMVLPPLIFAGLAGVFIWGMSRENPNELPTALAGRNAPAVSVTPMTGLPEMTGDMLADGNVKLVNFWASWCGPCRVEHPQLESLAAEGMPIYGVNYKDKPANALGFLQELGNPYVATGADADGRMGLEWGVYGVPETFVIDGDGKVVFRFAGPLTPATVDAHLRPALEKAQKPAS